MIVVIGAGGAGLIAALAAAHANAKVTLVDSIDPTRCSENDFGNTARSTGLIPAAGSALQFTAGISGDSPELMAQDILNANSGECNKTLLLELCRSSSTTIDWLTDKVGIELECKTDFLYHGHSLFRMHGPPTGYGKTLVSQLAGAVSANPSIRTRYGETALRLVGETGGGVCGVVLSRNSDDVETTISDVSGVVLATCGFGGSKNMVKQYLGDSMAQAHYHGSPHDCGSGIEMGIAMGGAVERMGSYQGHATVTVGQKPLLVTYGVIVNGGILVNSNGERFGNENVGYSEFSSNVLAQGSYVVEVFGQNTAAACKGTQLDQVFASGQVSKHSSLEELAKYYNINADVLKSTVKSVNECARTANKDEFCRSGHTILQPPFYSIKVRAALFHTQGGLRVDSNARVLAAGSDNFIPGLYATGGAAAGISGNAGEGYLSGNGLLAAAVMGKWAGEAAASYAQSRLQNQGLN